MGSKKFFIIGLIGSVALLILYFLILTLANSFSHAVSQFSEMWYWILVLAIAFGVQVGLYAFIKERQKIVSGKVLFASGGISTGSMIACCLHHLVDVLPILGLAAVSVLLIQYQVFFIVFGVLTNLVGMVIMLEIIQKHQLAPGFLRRVLVYNMGFIKKISIGISLILLLFAFLLTNNQSPTNSSNTITAAPMINLPSKSGSQNGVTFEVDPMDFNFEGPVSFRIKIDAHSGSLDFSPAPISILEDDQGNQYQPLNWDGSLPGGHHQSGILTFPRINNSVKRLQLIIGADSDLEPLVFSWNLE